MPPKTASNSIRHSLEHNGVNFFIDNNPYPQIHLKLSEIVKRYNVENVSDYKIIQIVREPYHKFVSSFFFQKKIVPQEFDVIFRNYSLEEFSEHLVDSLKSENFIESFYGNKSYVEYCIKSGKSWGGSRLYDTQKSWNDLGLDVTYFKLENIKDDTSELEKFIGIPIKKLSHINSQNIQTRYTELITPRVRDIVIEIFKEDFKEFGYEI